ncbi:MAG: allophanate hydrolase [Pseudomonadales bacterium]|jgi:allophanate hydrolase|nr:allophanate hydrolase [Pseudomonadales bacterium]
MGTFDEVRAAAQAGASLEERLAALAAASSRHAAHHSWIERLSPEASLAHATGRDGPLSGLAFAIKDNIDLAGVPTTAACPAYGYVPERSATAVARLLEAGAVPLGKTNLDQFATGLVGTRSPHGACRNALFPERISGGSSSGSAVAVALGEADFALGTDTAGSGRIPAAFNGLVGLKASRGLIPTTGVVPACRSLDCVTTFTRCAADAATLLEILAGPDGEDPSARRVAPRWFRGPPRIGVPATAGLAFPDPDYGPEAFDAARARLVELGCELVEIDPAPFCAAGDLLYAGPWVAERTAAVGAFLRSHPEAVHPVTARIIGGGDGIDAVTAFRGFDRLRELALEANRVFEQVDAVLLPTADRFPTLAEVEAEPIAVNTALGRFTNFMNLLDYAAVAVPAGTTAAGLPFGVTLFAPAGADRALLELASDFEGRPWRATRGFTLALAGAHMSGLPLNGQITERGGRMLRAARTAPGYRLLALPGGPPQRPALVPDPDGSASIEIELWDLPPERIGDLLALVPSPLAFGKLRIDDGSEVTGFVGAAGAEAGARDVTEHGSWRAWLAAGKA